jgi:DNA-binding transcriptional LysR family regulator
MTLVQLRHFVALADAGSYVQAAKAVFLTQPALTRSILSLEDELGGKLFDRLGRRITLTQFGSEILQRASRLVSDAESLKRAGQWMHDGLVGKLRIGMSSAPGALYSTRLMLYMAQHHPKLHVQISRANTGVLVDALREQRLDAAIVDLRSMRPAADLLVTQSFELAAGFQARPEHPLVQLGRPVSLSEIMAYPMASTPLSDEVARVLIARYGPVANPDDMVTLHCDETLSIVDLARQSDVIVLTVNAVASDLVRLNVSPSLNATGRFGLVTLQQHQEAPALRIVREQLTLWGSA